MERFPPRTVTPLDQAASPLERQERCFTPQLAPQGAPLHQSHTCQQVLKKKKSLCVGCSHRHLQCVWLDPHLSFWLVLKSALQPKGQTAKVKTQVLDRTRNTATLWGYNSNTAEPQPLRPGDTSKSNPISWCDAKILNCQGEDRKPPIPHKGRGRLATSGAHSSTRTGVHYHSAGATDVTGETSSIPYFSLSSSHTKQGN